MRNKIHLYIEGLRADLDEGAFLLLNYTAEDLSNPVVVRNSFSKQITLKGTPANDYIFGHIYRNDRNTLYGSPYTGPNFDPCRKTSFVLYNDANEIIESGYLKLDSIEQTKRKRSYKVTLYGGLGSFLYGLSYKPNGDKMTLADLDFGVNLDFTIDRTAVSDAWARIGGDTSKPAKWDYINFAPCYTGLPPSPFDANKAIVKNDSSGLPATDGDFSANNGWSLVTFPEKVTGQEAKDYRSYLQTPVLRMKHLIDAVCGSLNNGGYTVNLDAEFFDSSNPYYEDLWLTLPQLSDLNIDEQSTTGSKSLTGYNVTVPDGGDISKLYALTLQLSFEFTLVNISPYTQFVMHCEDDWAAGMSPDDSPGYYLNYLEIQVVAKDANNAAIKTIVYRISTMQAPDYMVQMDDTFDYISGELYKDGMLFAPTFYIEEYGVSKLEVTVTPKALCWGHLRASSDAMQIFPRGTYDYNDAEDVNSILQDYDNCFLYYSIVTSSTVRTGATIAQASLLGGSKTPADYLLSYCKMFGIDMLVHKDAKEVDLILRKNFYSYTVTDISGRIDRARGMSKKPFAFDSRWYLFGNEAGGEFAEYYANKYGRPFGQFRLNTGYEFDAAEKNLTDSIVFKNGCEVVETSKYFCDVFLGASPVPSVFLGGGKYTLYKSGETKEFDITLPTTAIRQWNNSSHPMYDDLPKLQMHGSDNSHLDGRDVLLFFGGMKTPASNQVTLSDDTREMLSLNGNNPCWMPGYAVYDASWKISSMPYFTRYVWSGTNATKALDFGLSSEVQIPGASFNSAAPLFPQFWERYIADRYDDDSAVVTCYVDLRGFQVNENLLRKFYAFDGAIWALNRIIDHSITTNGPTKCEFVKVQDTTNYTTY